jgi:hypothetical protein
MFMGGWNESASTKSQPSVCANNAPTVDFPDPVTPMTMMIMIGCEGAAGPHEEARELHGHVDGTGG